MIGVKNIESDLKDLRQTEQISCKDELDFNCPSSFANFQGSVLLIYSFSSSIKLHNKFY